MSERNSYIRGHASIIIAFIFVSMASRGQSDSSRDSLQDSASIDYSFDSTKKVLTPNEDSNTLYFLGKNENVGIYDTSRIQLRQVPDSIAHQFAKDPAFWYAKQDQAKREMIQRDESAWQKFWLRFGEMVSQKNFRRAMWFLIITLFLVIVMWFLAQNRIGIFNSRKEFAISTSPESEVETLFQTDFPEAIAGAARAGHFRYAIRLHFLWLLRSLSEHQWIDFRVDRTNADYLRQLQGKTHYEDFHRLSRIYEYVWYGNFEVGAAGYDSIAKDFVEVYQKLNAEP